MLIGANRLFALPNVDDTERILPSSPQVKGEGCGRFENFLYNTSGQKTQSYEGIKTVASQLSGLLSMASKDGRLNMPSFAAPIGEQEGTMVTSKMEGALEEPEQVSLPDKESDLEVEDIVSSQLDDLLSSILGPLADKGVDQIGTCVDISTMTEDIGHLEPQTDNLLPPLGDTGPIEPQMRHYEAMAELSARPEILSSDSVAPVVGEPSASVIPLNQPTPFDLTQADTVDSETVAPKAQPSTELSVTQIKLDQSVASSIEAAPSAKPEGTPTLGDPQGKVEPTKPEAIAQPDRLPPSEAAINSEVVKPEPPTDIGLSVSELSESGSPLDRLTPFDLTTQADTVDSETVAPKAQPSTELSVTQIKLDQAVASSGEPAPLIKPEGMPAASEPPIKVEESVASSIEAAPSAKLEGTTTLGDPQGKVEPTKPEAIAQPDRLPPSEAAINSEVVKPEPSTGIGLSVSGPSESGSPLDRLTPFDLTTHADTVDSETVAPKAQPSTELSVTQIKLDQAVASSGEPAPLIKPEGMPAASEPPIKVEESVASSIEAAPSAKPEGTPTLGDPQGKVEPIKPEAIAQPDRLPPSEAAINSEVVKPEPSTGIGLSVSGPSESGSPLDRLTPFDLTTQADTVDSETVAPKAQPSTELSVTQIKLDQAVASSGEPAPLIKPEGMPAASEPPIKVEESVASSIEAAPSEKSEGTPTLGDPQGKVEPTKPEAIAQPDRLPPSEAAINSEVVKPEPSTGIGLSVSGPSESGSPLDRLTPFDLTTQADTVDSETVAPKAQPSTELSVTQIKLDQAVASSGEAAPLIKPEGMPAASEPPIKVEESVASSIEAAPSAKLEGTTTLGDPQGKVEPTKPETIAQPDRLPPSEAAINSEVVKPEPSTGIGLSVSGPSESGSPLDRLTPFDLTTHADTVDSETVAPKAQPSTELSVTQIKLDQAVASSGEPAPLIKPEGMPAASEPPIKVEESVASSIEAAPSAKPEGTPTLGDPQGKVEPTKPEAIAQPDRLPPSEAAINSEVVKPEPSTGIGLSVSGPSESGSPLDRLTPFDLTTQADTVDSETVAPKAQPSTELSVTQIKLDQAVASSGEPAPLIKPEGMPAASEPPIKVEESVASSIEAAPSEKSEGTPTLGDPQGKVEPTKPEAIAQPDRLPPSEAAINSEVVKPEPSTGIGLSVSGPSESGSPLDRLTPFDLTTQADTVDSETVAPKAQPSTELSVTQIKLDQAVASSGEPAPLIKPEGMPAMSESQAKVEPIRSEIGSKVKADQVFAPSGEVASSTKPVVTQPVSIIAESAQVATAIAQESVPQRIKILTPRTVQSRGYSISAESISLSDIGEGKASSLLEPKAKEAPMFLSSWTPEKREEKFQPVTEISENKPEASFQRVVDQGLENLVVQADTRQSVQPKSEPVPTQTMYLPQKGSDALPHGLVQVVRHVMADGTQKATVIIDPPALGRVEVEVRATSTGIEASFKVDSVQVRDMIKPQIPVLQDMLSQQGIAASSISVDIRQGDERRSPWRDSLDSIKLRRRRGATEEEELEIPSMDNIARLDMERGVLQWYA